MVLEFCATISGPAVAAVVLRANSLVVFEGEAYLSFFHRIADIRTTATNDGGTEVVPVCTLNCDSAAIAPGALLQRPPRRMSLVPKIPY